MGSFIIRRVFYAIIMLIVVSFVSFIIISLPAGDFMDQKIAELQARGDQSAAPGSINTVDAMGWTSPYSHSIGSGSAISYRVILEFPLSLNAL